MHFIVNSYIIYIYSNFLKVDPNVGLIKWEHFEILHKEDKKVCDSQLRVCPKITDNHLQLLNTCLKMRVRLAVQVSLSSSKLNY